MATLPEDVFEDRKSHQHPRESLGLTMQHKLESIGADAMSGIHSGIHSVIELPHHLLSRIRDKLPGANQGGKTHGAGGGAAAASGDDDDDDDDFELLTSDVGGGDDGEGVSLVFNEIEWLNLLSKISECV